jgi:hypothetical protein
LYSNIRELLQTVFPGLRQVQPDGALSGLFEGFKFRRRQCKLQIAESVTSAGNGHILSRFGGNDDEESIWWTLESASYIPDILPNWKYLTTTVKAAGS